MKARQKVIAIFSALAVCACVIVGLYIWQPWTQENETEQNSNLLDSPTIVDNAETDFSDDTSTVKEVPTLVDAVISSPEFTSEEDASYYEENWHTDGELRSKYGYKTVVTSEGTEYVAGELLVTFYGDVSDELINSVASIFGGEVSEIDDSATMNRRYATILFADDADIEALAQQIEESALVYSASINGVGSLSDVEIENNREGDYESTSGVITDPLRVGQTYLSQSGFTDAWKVAKCSGSIKVAVIDSGIDYDHPDLVDNIDTENAYDAIVNDAPDTSVSDVCGHGTAVAGIVAAEAYNGVGIIGCSYDAVILPIRVANEKGRINDDDVKEALEHILDMDDEDKPDVINMSFRGFNYSQDIQDLISQLNNYGIVCVAAVGNDSIEGSTGDSVAYPAGYTGVIGVGAVDSSNKHCDFSNVNSSVDICALGYNVYTTTDPDSEFGQGKYYASSYEGTDTTGKSVTYSIAGTSFAAPQVSAAAALLVMLHPDANPNQIKDILVSSASVLSDSDAIDDVLQYGSGLLNAAGAVGYEDTSTDTNSAFWSTPSAVRSIDSNLLKSYAVRDGCPPLEFLGITNTNFDFVQGAPYLM